MPYGEIIKRSFTIALKNRVLWIFGFFIALIQSGSSFNYQMDEGDTLSPAELADFVYFTPSGIIAVIIAVAIVVIILLVLAFVSQGSIISGVKKIEDGIKPSAKELWRAGKYTFWRVVGINALIAILVLVAAIVFFAPGLYLFFVRSEVIAGIALLALGFILFFALIIMTGITRLLALRNMVIHDTKTIASIKEGYSLFTKNLGQMIVVGILAALIQMGFLAAGLAVLGMLAIPVVLLWGIVFLLGFSLSAIIIGICGIILGILGLAVIGTLLTTYNEALWTLAFLSIKPVNMEGYEPGAAG